MPAANKPSRRRRLFKEQKGKCFWCGQAARKPVRGRMTKHDPLRWTADHVVPRSRGGPNTRDNVVGACYGCNSLRNAVEMGLLRKKKPKFVVPAKYLPIGFLKF